MSAHVAPLDLLPAQFHAQALARRREQLVLGELRIARSRSRGGCLALLLGGDLTFARQRNRVLVGLCELRRARRAAATHASMIPASATASSAAGSQVERSPVFCQRAKRMAVSSQPFQ